MLAKRHPHKSHFVSVLMSSSIQHHPPPLSLKKKKTLHIIWRIKPFHQQITPKAKRRVSVKTRFIPLLLIRRHSGFFIGPFSNALSRFHPVNISSISSSFTAKTSTNTNSTGATRRYQDLKTSPSWRLQDQLSIKIIHTTTEKNTHTLGVLNVELQIIRFLSDTWLCIRSKFGEFLQYRMHCARFLP